MRCEGKMILESIKISNHKSFFAEQTISLKKGFNLFIGKNNSGKTTALELLDLPSEITHPHKSILNHKEKGLLIDSRPTSKIEISISTEDLLFIYGGKLILPLPSNPPKKNSELIESFAADDTLKFAINTTGNSQEVLVKISENNYTSISNTEPFYKYLIATIENENEYSYEIKEEFLANNNALDKISKIKGKIYRFSPLRTPVARHDMNSTPILEKNARNLAYCINYFSTNDPAGHGILCELINRIFPEIHSIQSVPNNGNFELRCLPQSPHLRRDDLAIPIDQMGTGIGNIVSILYVVLASTSPHVIAIDEPNLFLHPKALRELLQILESHGSQHQYILTAHSPEVLTAIEPSTITYFDISNFSSKIKQFTKHEYHEFRSELSDLGIRMTDLHAKDRVLWVEGPTEEIVIPMLLRKFCPEISAGTAVLRVTHTGTFESNKVPITEVVKTYERLTNTSLAPPMMAIILDKESRKKAEIQKIERASNKKLRFLPYRMIENYVLSAPAIQAVLKNNGIEINIAEIESLLPATPVNGTQDHGANILKEIFNQLSDAKLEFRKTTHTPELFEWILENNEEALSDLKKFILDVCKQDN